jgi:hypothetical protein
MIRAALIWLALGYSMGGLLLAHKGIAIAPRLWLLREAHIHALLMGWTLQLAAGVAFWILPRLDASGARGDERPVWLSFAAINAGAAVGVAAAVSQAAGLYALAGALYALAALAFVRHAWPRVRPFQSERPAARP